MTEQETLLKRAKNNRNAWKWMDAELKAFMEGFGWQYWVVLSKWNGWRPVESDGVLYDCSIYRIHKDCPPPAPEPMESMPPKMPGYVLAKIERPEDGCARYLIGGAFTDVLHHAISNGALDYLIWNPILKIWQRWHTPYMWLDENGARCLVGEEGVSHVYASYVIFPEVKNV